MTTHLGTSDDGDMAISPRPPTGDGKDSLASPVADTVDHVLACYIEWREDAATVRDAYGLWSAAPNAEEAGLFSAYLAALDQEQSAAGSYALAMARLERLL